MVNTHLIRLHWHAVFADPRICRRIPSSKPKPRTPAINTRPFGIFENLRIKRIKRINPIVLVDIGFGRSTYFAFFAFSACTMPFFNMLEELVVIHTSLQTHRGAPPLVSCVTYMTPSSIARCRIASSSCLDLCF